MADGPTGAPTTREHAMPQWDVIRANMGSVALLILVAVGLIVLAGAGSKRWGKILGVVGIALLALSIVFAPQKWADFAVAAASLVFGA